MARNDPESWVSWHEEDSFKLDAESPIAMSRSLWDEIAHTEESNTLFASTPAAEITEAGAMLSCLSHQDTVGQQHCLPEHDSPRQKRRRMLFFPGADRCSGDYESPDRAEDTNSAWYTDAGNSLTPLRASYEQHPQEPWATSWFKNSCEDQNGRSIQLPVCQSAGAPVKDTLDKKAWKMSIGSPATGRKRAGIERPRPVAYPFALLKPCGATGDVTLSDINQRIQTPPLTGSRGMELEPPSAAPVAANDGGAGLSGKSVVALTRIHTEGNGSITIMRTKG